MYHYYVLWECLILMLEKLNIIIRGGALNDTCLYTFIWLYYDNMCGLIIKTPPFKTCLSTTSWIKPFKFKKPHSIQHIFKHQIKLQSTRLSI